MCRRYNCGDGCGAGGGGLCAVTLAPMSVMSTQRVPVSSTASTYSHPRRRVRMFRRTVSTSEPCGSSESSRKARKVWPHGVWSSPVQSWAQPPEGRRASIKVTKPPRSGGLVCSQTLISVGRTGVRNVTTSELPRWDSKNPRVRRGAAEVARRRKRGWHGRQCWVGAAASLRVTVCPQGRPRVALTAAKSRRAYRHDR